MAESLKTWQDVAAGRGEYSVELNGQGYPAAWDLEVAGGGETGLDVSSSTDKSVDIDRAWRKGVWDELFRRGFGKDYMRFMDCEEKGYTLKCDDCGYERAKIFFCGLRICPECARRFAGSLFHQIMDIVGEINANRKRGWSIKLITLTLKKGEGWPDMHQLRAMVKAMGRYLPELWNSYLREDGAGAVASMEIGPSGNVHAHLVYYGPFIPKKELSQRWSEITGGSYILDLEMITGGKGVWEATKYACKMRALSPGQVVDVYEALKGARRVRCYGVFYNRVVVHPECPCPECGGTSWTFGGWLTQEEFKANFGGAGDRGG